ncbi:MAG: hypothetical protein ACKVWR_21800 [Acidimicrobiales bacterium]
MTPLGFSVWSFLAGAATTLVIVAFLTALCSLIATGRGNRPYDQNRDQ